MQNDDEHPRKKKRSKVERLDREIIGSVIAEKYRITAFIAKGGGGRIFLAEQQPLGRKVAIKILNPSLATEQDQRYQKRFLREAETCARLKHPNTVTVFDYGRIRYGKAMTFYMVMEYVEGKNLYRENQRLGALEPERAFRIAIEIARSLKEAHQHGVVHRDLKPSNVMLVETDEGESVKVLDFGIAKVLQDDLESLTQEDRIIGSPRYMSPEQIRHDAIDARSDIYSLGILLYEILTGDVPFRDDSPLQTLMSHLNEPVPPLKSPLDYSIAPEFEAIVLRCLDKEPEDRYQSIDEFLEAMRFVEYYRSTIPPETAEAVYRSIAPFHTMSSAPPKQQEPRVWLWILGALIGGLGIGALAMVVLLIALGVLMP